MNKIFGVLPSEPDQRDYIFKPRTWSYPQKFSRRQYVVEYEDQGSIGSCVANGGCSTLETHANHFGQMLDLSRMFPYGAGRYMEGRLGQEGMYVRTFYKVLYKYGVPLEAEYPYDLNMKDVNPPQSVYDLAAARKIGRYEFIYNRDSTYGALSKQQIVDRIKAALLEGLLPTIAFSVTDSIYHMTGPWTQQQYKMVGPNSPSIGGHLMYVVGWDDTVQKFEVVNSWGQQWGDNGIGGFPYDIVTELFFESWVARDFAGMVVPEEPGIKLEYSNRFSIGFRVVPQPAEVGKTVNVWVAARLPDGKWVQKHGEAGDVWKQLSVVPPVPSFTKTLTNDNPMKAVNWLQLTPYAGGEVFVAYSEDLNGWMNPTNICTIQP